MTALTNFIIIILILSLVTLFLGYRFLSRRQVQVDTSDEERERFTLSAITEFLHSKTSELTTSDLYSLGLSEEDFMRRTRQRQELKEALKNCNTGDYKSKVYVREFYYELLTTQYGFNEENIDWAIPFNKPSQLSARELFDILLHLTVQEQGNQALGFLLDEYDIAKPKADGGYRFTEEELRAVYKERIKRITFDEKMRILVQRLYSQIKGFGVIDDIRDMTIDGVSGGVSGVPNRMDNYDDEEVMMNTMVASSSGLNSVWVMYEGKSIHFSFLDFEHEAELRRVVQNVYKYNYPGQLSETKPYLINEMHDGSRVTVVRPKLAETWAFFIRKKYDMRKLEVGHLITHPSAGIPITIMKYLMKGNRVTAITGSQGSGKTTLLIGLIDFINRALNIRVQETSFELNLRSRFPDRNILTFQETDTVSGQEGLDLQKKTDGAVNILGEVASDPVAAWMIQTAQVASLFTVFTHHAKTFSDLVYAMRNSLLNVGLFSNEKIAEQQVVSVLEFDIHLNMDYDGTRYVERITESIPIQHKNIDFQKMDGTNETKEEKIDTLLTVATNYFKQQTQEKLFEARNIVEFVDGKYVARHPISKERQNEIMNHLSEEERADFLTFINDVWGDVA